MKNLIVVLSTSLSFFAFDLNAQFESKKYIKKNKKARVITYGDSSVYSRGLYIDSAKMLIGNSDGTIFMYKSEWEKSKLLFKLPNFSEVRDIEKSGEFYYGIQSGETGKLVQIDKNGPIKIIEIPEWKGVFLDGLDFYGNTGFLMGDPIDGKFSLFHSKDNGATWNRCEGAIEAFKDEAGFAASGTNVQILNDSTYTFISGGMKSRFFKSTDNGASWKAHELPYFPGQSTGPYSMCFSNDSIGVLVGGDFTDPDLRLNTTFYTYDGGESWFNSFHATRGYRSCVFFINDVYYACGRNGIDFSLNNGIDWIPFANGTYFSLGSDGNKLYATMKHGKIKEFDLMELK